MSRTRIIDHDPITNITSYWHDHGDGRESVWEEQSVHTLLEQNQAIRRTTKRRDRWGNGKYVAEIPLIILTQLERDGILADPQAFNKWLDRPENQPFRTADASLSR